MIRKYNCMCGHEFKRDVYYKQGESDPIRGFKGKKSSISTQVECPKCGNNVPTWKKIQIGDKWVKKR